MNQTGRGIINKLPEGLLDEDATDLYENAPCAYLSTLPDGTIVKANRTFFDWTGYTRDTLVGYKRFQDILTLPGQIFHDTHFAPLLQMQGYVRELAFDIVCAGQERLPVLLNASVKRDQAGGVQGVRITLLDATSRRSYENELLLARKKAQAAEAEVRALNQSLSDLLAERTFQRDRLWRLSQDVLLIADLQGKVKLANPAFPRLLGWSDEEGQTISLTDLMHRDERRHLVACMQKLAQGQPVRGETFRVRHRDGSFRWLSWNAVPEEGMLYMTGRDITEDVRRQEDLSRNEEALRQAQKMEAVGQLAGGIAHDFNNIMAGVIGNLDLMALKIQLGQAKDLTPHIKSAKSVALRAATTVSRLLTFSRRQTMSFETTAINDRIRFARDLALSTIGPEIHIDVELDASNPKAECDPNQLENALLNLLVNARDAMQGQGVIAIGSQALHLEAGQIGHLPKGEYVHLWVRDNGCGMPQSVARKAFDPFFTTKPAGAGTGLGLSMVYGFCRQSDGDARIDSLPGQGTTIHLYLPASQEVPSAAGALPAVADESHLNSVSGRVLLVDDEEVVRELLAEALKSHGYVVEVAGDAAQARAALQGASFDLLVTDMGLPGDLNGKQLASQAQVAAPDLKVLFITGYAAPGSGTGRELEPSDHVLTKPFDLLEFLGKVDELIGR